VGAELTRDGGVSVDMDVEFNAVIASKLAPTGFALPWHNPAPFISGTCKGGDSLTVSSKTLHLFGIKACDTMKKARTWLDEHAVSYDFHDYKAVGIDREHLTQWCNEHGWEVVLNRAGTTFRKLDDERKADLDQSKAIELMLAQPSMIKRPVLDLGDRTLIGFKPDIYAAALK
jgi:Spx/MgsR family transcriptional regulator